MSSPSAFTAFKTVLEAYAAGAGALPVRYENEFVQDLLDAGTPAWVYVEVWGDRYYQDTQGAPGANVWAEDGTTNIHVMVPSGDGSSDARGHCVTLMNLFREKPVSSIFMPEMSVGAGQPGRDFPNYYAMTLTISWMRRDITSA
ncbi:MAG: hypothetical protein ACTHNH_08455 [Mesorhizobium sp.]